MHSLQEAAGASPQCGGPGGSVLLNARSGSRRAHLAVAGLFLIIPHVMYYFLWLGSEHPSLGNDYLIHQPQQQLLFMQALRDGYFPLWFPGDSGGIPFSNYLFAGAYWPVTWLMCGCDAVFNGGQYEVLTHVHLLGLSLGGFFTYLLMRRLGLSAPAGVIAGAIFIFNFRMLDAFRYGMALDTVVWLPVLLYLAERMVARPRLHLCICYALAEYMLLTPGHLQEALYIVYFVNLYGVARLWILYRESGRRDLRQWWVVRPACFGAGQLLGLGLAAVYLLPLIQDTLPLFTVRNNGTAEYYFLWHLTWPDVLYNLFFPWLAKAPSAFYPSQMAWLLAALGVGGLLSTRFGLARAQRWMLAFFVIVFAVCLLYALGPLTPVGGWLNAIIPFFDRVRSPGRLMTVGMFAASAICGWGVDWLGSALRNYPAMPRRLFAPSVIFGIAGLGLALGLAGGVIEWREGYVSLPLLWNVSKYTPVRLSEDAGMMPTMAVVILAVALFNLIVLAGAARGRLRGATAVGLILAVSLVEIGVYHHRGTWMVQGPVASARSEQFKAVDTYHRRVIWDPPFYLYLAGDVHAGVAGRSAFFREAMPAPMLRFLEQGGAAAHRLYYQTVPGYETPRAYLTPEVKLAGLDDVNGGSGQQIEAGPADRSGGVEVEAYAFNRVSFRTTSQRFALLNYNDAYSEDWQARIDGQPTTVYRSRQVFKAVVVPAGAHTVEFIYRPKSFEIGLTVSLVCGCIAASLAALCIGGGLGRRAWGALLAGMLSVAAARGVRDTIEQMADQGGRINFEPSAPRPSVRDWTAAGPDNDAVGMCLKAAAPKSSN